jgi:hypothetical protein
MLSSPEKQKRTRVKAVILGDAGINKHYILKQFQENTFSTQFVLDYGFKELNFPELNESFEMNV